MSSKVIIAGATGLIGSKLLKILLDESAYTEVMILVRSPIGITHVKLKEIIIDFDKLEEISTKIDGHAIFCCLGTTQNKTPDKAIYKKIDHDYPVKLAQLAFANGVSQCHLVSAIGANSKSNTFYLKLKGETEQDIETIGIKTVHIYRPSLITGDRKEPRFLERLFTGIFRFVDPLLIGGLRKYRSIPAQTIAMAIYKASLKTETGVFIHQFDQIKQLA